MSTPFPSIPEPSSAPDSNRTVLRSVKEVLEIMLRRRGVKSNGVVTWQDLVNLGLITSSQIPTTSD